MVTWFVSDCLKACIGFFEFLFCEAIVISGLKIPWQPIVIAYRIRESESVSRKNEKKNYFAHLMVCALLTCNTPVVNFRGGKSF